MKTPFLFFVSITTLFSIGWAEDAPSPIDIYRNLEFPATSDFDDEWRERVAAEFGVVNDAKLDSLRTALKDDDPLVRSIAARTLGIRGDKTSADALADLALNDQEFMVRIRAVEALGLLKLKRQVIEKVKKDPHAGVNWVADLALDQFDSKHDLAAQIRNAFAKGIKRDEMGIAKVGQLAPDFTAQTLDGKPFKLSSVIGKKPIAIYFAAFDQ